MNVGLLIITHDGIGSQLWSTATRMLGETRMRCRVLAAEESSDPDHLIEQALQLVAELDQGHGVLVLTDMFGATPSNVARRLLEKNVACIAGVNLPMLVRVLNYHELELPALAEKAYSGGREGVMICVSDAKSA